MRDNAVVVFLDILGFKSLSVENKQLILTELPKMIKTGEVNLHIATPNDQQSIDCTIFAISDSIIIILKDLSQSQNLLNRLVLIQYQVLLKFSLMIRGGVAYGEVYYSIKTSSYHQVKIFGKAYELAYELAEGNLRSDLPIIQVDAECLEFFYNKESNRICSVMSCFTYEERELAIADSDGESNDLISQIGSCWGINWIKRSLIKEASGAYNLLSLNTYLEDSEWLSPLEGFLLKSMNVTSPLVRKKYTWTLGQILVCLKWHLKSQSTAPEDDEQVNEYCAKLEDLCNKIMRIIANG